MTTDHSSLSIAVCLAAFNRRDKTLACLESLYAASLPDGAQLVVHLLDDASTDGTADAVAIRFLAVHIHHGNGQCFWAGGMRIAYGAALSNSHDFYIWLNDDVELFPDTIHRSLACHEALVRAHGGAHLIAGAMRPHDSQTTTYGGFERASALVPWRFRRVDPWPDRARPCATINGNFVLIPAAIAQKLRNIPDAYRHTLADLDLGLRARQAGFGVWLMPGYAGLCEANAGGRAHWLAPNLSLRQRLARMDHPLGYPLRPAIAYARHFGLMVPLLVAAPYVKLLGFVMRSWFGRRNKRS